MKIPFLPFCIVSIKFLKSVEETAKIAKKQIAVLMVDKHDLVQIVRRLPLKYRKKSGIQDRKRQK